MFSTEEKMVFGGLFGWVASIGVGIAGLITHIVVCIQTEQWVLLIAGSLAAPVGVVHGIGHWFGAW